MKKAKIMKRRELTKTKIIHIKYLCEYYEFYILVGSKQKKYSGYEYLFIIYLD